MNLTPEEYKQMMEDRRKWESKTQEEKDSVLQEFREKFRRYYRNGPPIHMLMELLDLPEDE